MSEGLRKELVGTGVKVTNILPGMCNTQLANMVGEEVKSRLIQPEDVGLLVWEAVNKPERWVDAFPSQWCSRRSL